MFGKTKSIAYQGEVGTVKPYLEKFIEDQLTPKTDEFYSKLSEGVDLNAVCCKFLERIQKVSFDKEQNLITYETQNTATADQISDNAYAMPVQKYSIRSDGGQIMAAFIEKYQELQARVERETNESVKQSAEQSLGEVKKVFTALLSQLSQDDLTIVDNHLKSRKGPEKSIDETVEEGIQDPDAQNRYRITLLAISLVQALGAWLRKTREWITGQDSEDKSQFPGSRAQSGVVESEVSGHGSMSGAALAVGSLLTPERVSQNANKERPLSTDSHGNFVL